LENEDEPFKYTLVRTNTASYGQGLKSSSNCHAVIIVAIVRQKESQSFDAGADIVRFEIGA